MKISVRVIASGLARQDTARLVERLAARITQELRSAADGRKASEE